MVRLYFTVRLLQTVVPPIITAVVYILSLTGVALSVVLASVINASAAIADHWVDRAVARGFPTIWTPHLYYGVRTLAVLMMIVGWILLSHITVFIVKWIF